MYDFGSCFVLHSISFCNLSKILNNIFKVPEIPKKPVPEEKKPVPVPKKKEAPPAKGIPPFIPWPDESLYLHILVNS